MYINFLNNYVIDLLISLEQNLSAYTKEKKPEYLHYLRLDIKKISAVFSFAKKIYNKRHDIAVLKPLFHDGGDIREIIINIGMLHAAPHPPEKLITQLKEKENILNQRFMKNEWLYKKHVKDFRKDVCLPENLPGKKTIIKYFKKEKKKANKILRHIDREGMHRYRKKIKKIMYVYNALPKKIQIKIALNEEKFNEQQKRVGDWHDTYAAINLFSSDHFPGHSSKLIVNLKAKEKTQFDKLHTYLTNKRK